MAKFARPYAPFRKGRTRNRYINWSGLIGDLYLQYTCMYNLIQKQLSCKKVCGPQEGHYEKDVKSKVGAKNGCDGRLIGKI